MNPPLSISF